MVCQIVLSLCGLLGIISRGSRCCRTFGGMKKTIDSKQFDGKEVLQTNLKAIQIAFGRTPITKRLEQTLARYEGFHFCPALWEDRPVQAWRKDQQVYASVVTEIRKVLQNLWKGDFEQRMNALKEDYRGNLFLPEALTEAIVQGVYDTCSLIRTVYDPFPRAGRMLHAVQKLYGNEGATCFYGKTDAISQRIIERLYPEFQAVEKEEELQPVDLLVTSLTDYQVSQEDPQGTTFLYSMIDRVREGGLIALVVPYRYIHSTAYQEAREQLMKESRLLTLLPIDYELLRAHTGMVLPLYVLVLQRMVASHKALQREELFLHPTAGLLRTNTFKTLRRVIKENQPANAYVLNWISNSIYGYYSMNPALLLNSGQGLDGEPYLLVAVGSYHYYQPKGDFMLLTEELSREASSHFKRGYFLEPKQPKRRQGIKRLVKQMATVVPYTDRTLTTQLTEGLSVVFKGQLGQLHNDGGTWFFHPVEPNAVLMDYISLRELYGRWMSDEENLAIRSQVVHAYDYFLKSHGGLLRHETLLATDPVYPKLKALVRLQEGEEVRGELLSQMATDRRKVAPKKALLASLDELGRVDMDYLMALTGLSLLAVRDKLAREIFFDPIQKGWVTRDQLLMGNLYDKAEVFEWVEQLGETEREERDRSVAELRAATPEPIPFDLIGLSLGERWMDTSLLEEFAKSLYGVKTSITYEPVTDTYAVTFARSVSSQLMWSIEGHMDAAELFKCALQDTYPLITRQQFDGERNYSVTDATLTQLAESRINDIKEHFEQWLTNLPDQHKQQLADAYNRRFNGRVRPRFDGSFQTFPGLDLSGFPYKELYPSQKDAIWMIKQNGGGIVDHEVGTGKTMIMVVAAHEMRRLGLVRKPLILAMNANIHDIADAYRKAYPNDRLFYPGKTGFAPATRQEALAQMRDEEWDCILLTHSQFGLIPHSVATERGIIEEELAEIARSIEVFKGKRLTVTVLEKRVKVLENRLDKLGAAEDNRGICFEQLGVDHILVDESHHFKNLAFSTRHRMVAGLGNMAGSSKADHLYMAIQEIQKQRGADLGATFLSGTTVINSLTELYALFRYLRPRALSGQSIRGFDAWAAVFAKKSREYEFSVTNTIISKERMRRFMKVPELAAFYGEITDYRTAEMIGIERPKKNTIFVKVEQTDTQKAYIEKLIAFAKTGNGLLIGRPPLSAEEMKSKMLIATNYARKMALDMRLIDPDKYGAADSSKLRVAAERIAAYYKRYEQDKGTQLVFCDLGVLNKGSWSVYQELTDILIKEWGIPAEEIRSAQEFTSEKARRAFCDQVNEGAIRVVLGSTQVLGTGLNIQQRAVAVHHLDSPWRPADLEQREGRAIRKGNWLAKTKAGNQVDVLIYATENSLDLFKFNLLQNKQTFVTQMKQGQYGGRMMDEGSLDEDTGMSFAEYVAILSGNNDLLEKAKLEKKIAQLERDQKLFQEETYRLSHELENLNKSVKVLNQLAKDLLADYTYYIHSAEAGFTDTQGNTLAGKPLGLYLSGYRGDKHCAEPKVLGAYRGHTVYIHSVGDKTQFGMVGHSGRHYGSKTGLPLKHEAAEEWLAGQGPLWAERAEEAKGRAEEQQTAIQELTKALDHREWNGKQTLDQEKAELKVLNERIRQNVDVLDGLSPDQIEITDVTLDTFDDYTYELCATVGAMRICRSLSEKYVLLMGKRKLNHEEIARNIFIWGNPDYVTRQTDQEHLRIYYEQWLDCMIQVNIPGGAQTYGTLDEVYMDKGAPDSLPTVYLVIHRYHAKKQIIQVSYENKLHVKNMTRFYW